MLNINGYSLPEVLAVLTVLSIASIVILFNMRFFSQDQDLKVASGGVHSQIRSTQANSTTNLKCLDQSSKLWQIRFSKENGQYKVKTQCQYTSPSANSPLPAGCLAVGNNLVSCIVYDNHLTKILIDNFHNGANCSLDIESLNSEVLISFSPVLGKITFSSNAESLNCPINSWQKMYLVLKIGANSKAVVIDKVGLIYEQ